LSDPPIEQAAGMTGELLVRSVSLEDYPRWLPLWDGYNAYYGRIAGTALPMHVTKETWSRFFNPNEPVFALVAEMNGELVGLAHYLFHRSTTSIAPFCYLQDLFTAETARGQGVATALIERVCAAAKDQGSPRVYWQTQESNQMARRLYDKLAERSGFLVYRRSLL
jgi:GNAT superfamily N-acetyltransferase